jgi:hypothetical protein
MNEKKEKVEDNREGESESESETERDIWGSIEEERRLFECASE